MVVIIRHSCEVRSFPLLRAATALLAAGALTGGCAGGADTSAGGDRVRIVAAFYPLQFLAERIGGDRIQVSNLVKAGVEPHDLELSPRQVSAIASADLVIHLAGFQPAVDEAVRDEAGKDAFNVAAVQPLADAPPGAGD